MHLTHNFLKLKFFLGFNRNEQHKRSYHFYIVSQLCLNLHYIDLVIKEWCLCHKLWFLNPNVVDLRYFKLWLLLYQIIKVWNVIGLHNLVVDIQVLENWDLLQDSIPLSKWFKINQYYFPNRKKSQKYVIL